MSIKLPETFKLDSFSFVESADLGDDSLMICRCVSCLLRSVIHAPFLGSACQVQVVLEWQVPAQAAAAAALAEAGASGFLSPGGAGALREALASEKV